MLKWWGKRTTAPRPCPLLEKLRPDILFTDVKMAHMDGIELAERAREKYPDLKIVFLSAYSEVDYVRSALSGTSAPIP